MIRSSLSMASWPPCLQHFSPKTHHSNYSTELIAPTVTTSQRRHRLALFKSLLSSHPLAAAASSKFISKIVFTATCSALLWKFLRILLRLISYCVIKCNFEGRNSKQSPARIMSRADSSWPCSADLQIILHLRRVDGICGSGQNGTVKNWGVENAGVDISARCGRGGQCERNIPLNLTSVGHRIWRKIWFSATGHVTC